MILALDFLGGDDVQGLEFFPGMNLSGSLKRERVAAYLEQMQALFEVVPLGEYARRLLDRGGLRVRAPDFPSPPAAQDPISHG